MGTKSRLQLKIVADKSLQLYHPSHGRDNGHDNGHDHGWSETGHEQQLSFFLLRDRFKLSETVKSELYNQDRT